VRLPKSYQREIVVQVGPDEFVVTVDVTIKRLRPQEQEVTMNGPSMIQQPLWEGPLDSMVTA
jgi:hypothetical protein